MEGTEFKLTDAYRCDCPGCGSAMRYDIRSRGMLCESCGQSRTVDALRRESESEPDEKLDVVSFTCPSCGATLNTNSYEATGFCSYCGSDVVLTARLNSIARPSEIAPFRITREECESIYRKHINSARFMPKGLKDPETINRFRPVYVPYWRYKFKAEGKTTGTGVRKYSDSRYNYTDTYEYELKAHIDVDGALYDASSRFDDETAQLLNFRSRKQIMVPFHPAYLSGIYAETPDTDRVVFQAGIEAYAQDSFNYSASGKTGSKGFFELPKQHSFETEIVLMPVWLLANRQGERVLYTAINGVDGTIVCDLPVSNKKYALLTAALFCAFLAALLFSTILIVLRPNILMGISLLLAAAGIKDITPRMDSILSARAADTDPTRAMKRRHPNEDVPLKDPLPYVERRMGIGRLSRGGMFTLLAIAITVMLSFAFSMEPFSKSSFLSFLISDRGVGAPVLLISAGIMLFTTRYTDKKAAADGEIAARAVNWDRRILYFLRFVCITGFCAVVAGLPAITLWCYALSIVTMLLFCVAMFRFNRAQNEYVTRPVPLFGKEQKQ